MDKAICLMNSQHYTLQDACNRHEIADHINAMQQCACDAGYDSTYQVLSFAHSMIDLALCQGLVQPVMQESVDEYVRRVKDLMEPMRGLATALVTPWPGNANQWQQPSPQYNYPSHSNQTQQPNFRNKYSSRFPCQHQACISPPMQRLQISDNTAQNAPQHLQITDSNAQNVVKLLWPFAA